MFFGPQLCPLEQLTGQAVRLVQHGEMLEALEHKAQICIVNVFSRMRSEGSRFTWGSGGEAVFAKFCVCVRNRSQPFATVCGTAVRLSTVASASGEVQKACHVDSVAPQLYSRLQRRCVSQCSVPPQLYWRLQRRCLSHCSVPPQLYWCLQRRCLSECSVLPQSYWRLQRRCL